MFYYRARRVEAEEGRAASNIALEEAYVYELIKVSRYQGQLNDVEHQEEQLKDIRK